MFEPLEPIDVPDGTEVTVTIAGEPSAEDIEAFRRSAGSWRGLVDADRTSTRAAFPACGRSRDDDSALPSSIPIELSAIPAIVHRFSTLRSEGIELSIALSALSYA